MTPGSEARMTGLAGTFHWMAPEVLQSAAYTRASDVYSFAVVLWELRSLQVPWAQVGQWQVMHAVVEEAPPHQAKFPSTLPWRRLQRLRPSSYASLR